MIMIDPGRAEGVTGTKKVIDLAADAGSLVERALLVERASTRRPPCTSRPPHPTCSSSS